MMNHDRFFLPLPPEPCIGLLVQFQTPGQAKPYDRGSARLQVQAVTGRSRVDQRQRNLAGIPSANGLMDLWAEFRLLDLGERLGRFIGNFRETYFTPDKRNQQIVFSYKPKPGAEEAIYRQIADITISMKNTDYLKMPELVMNEISVRLSEREWQHYQTLKDEMVLFLPTCL